MKKPPRRRCTMRDYVDLDQIGTISTDNFRRYLLASGWRQRRLKAGYLSTDVKVELFTKIGPAGIALQLPLPNGTQVLDYRERLRDALQTLVDSERRPLARIVEAIQRVGYDIVRSAVPTALVKDDSIRLSSAKAYVAGMRELLASSATTEINRLPFFSHQLKEGLIFADSCSFGHTYKGSFALCWNHLCPALRRSLCFLKLRPYHSSGESCSALHAESNW